MTPLTKPQLAEIAARAEKASERCRGGKWGSFPGVAVEHPFVGWLCVWEAEAETGIEYPTNIATVHECEDFDDEFEYLVAAANAFPALIHTVAHWQARAEKAEGLLRKCTTTHIAHGWEHTTCGCVDCHEAYKLLADLEASRD